MRWGRPAILAVLALATSSCAKTVPSLASDLPGDVAQAERIFDARVKAHYPIGRASADLTRDLTAQGFDRPDFTPDRPTGWWAADFNSGDLFCNKVWSIRWRTDSAQKVSEIWGVYGLQCP